VISGEIMELHHKKHHQTYVTNLNASLQKYADAEAKKDISTMIQLQGAIKFNGGGHVNHSIFWTNLAPVKNGGGAPPVGKFAEKIHQQFGGLEKLIEQLSTTTIAIQGSGWGWLGYNKGEDRLVISTMSNQDPLMVHGLVPLLGIDVWEHAYYLQYKNVRADYVKNIWKIVNWQNVAEKFENSKK